ncbi:heart- and neural crest derivatives-expressed protein 2 [Patagioenas fasciata monilis]|uniref:Heart- and neural crest derivatives-expressed protein 2 n=1 Tax=Patagioenas fasciata monilis TaxID=372326 RepID=A0A1V4JGE3_PATFA|nr:heart- and neural crest derivatives-expressed protein 2 [Patagioenas fasciata monilis]
MEGGRVPEYANGAPGMDHSHYGGVPPGNGPPGLGGPRPVKRRGTANRKERRRTQSINSAFAELRECIPNVPADTKLSKIKTLRLATSYIAYLMDLLAKDDQNGEAEAFKAEIKKTDVKEEKRKKELFIYVQFLPQPPKMWIFEGEGKSIPYMKRNLQLGVEMHTCLPSPAAAPKEVAPDETRH